MHIPPAVLFARRMPRSTPRWPDLWHLHAGIAVSDHFSMASRDSFSTRRSLSVGNQRFSYYSLAALEQAGFTQVSRLPYSLKILLENLLRREDGRYVDRDDIQALASWDPAADLEKEIAFM